MDCVCNGVQRELYIYTYVCISNLWNRNAYNILFIFHIYIYIWNVKGIHAEYIYIHSYIRSICGIDVKYKYVSIYIYISTVNQLLTGINIKVEISSPDHH